MSNPRTWVREVRERYKLTQVELAERLGRRSNYISMIERGDYIPSQAFLNHLDLLDRSLAARDYIATLRQSQPSLSAECLAALEALERILTVETVSETRGIIKAPSEDDPPPPASIVVHPIGLSC